MESQSRPRLTTPLASYSHIRQVGPLFFIAGQGCRDPETNIWAGVTFDEDGTAKVTDFAAQVWGVLKNIEQVLMSRSLTKKHLVDIQVFLTDMDWQFPVLNQVWNEFFADQKLQPTRTTVAVSKLPGLNLVEMKAIASHEI